MLAYAYDLEQATNARMPPALVERHRDDAASSRPRGTQKMVSKSRGPHNICFRTLSLPKGRLIRR